MTPDTNITPIRSSNPQLYQAIKNIGDGSKQLINSIFPPPPIQNYKGRIIIPGTPLAFTDILAHRYHVVLPIDPSGYWTYNSITLTNVYITAKTAPSTTTFSVDILVAKNKGLTAFQSIFKVGFNPMLPVGVTTTHNVEFSINNLYQDDLGRVDILVTDVAVNDIELVLIGNYNYTENSVS